MTSRRLVVRVVFILLAIVIMLPVMIVLVYKANIDAQRARFARIYRLGGDVDEGQWPAANEGTAPEQPLGREWEPPFVAHLSVRGPVRPEFNKLLGEICSVRMIDSLSFSGVPVQDGQLRSLASRQSLRMLSLVGTDVTDAGLADLADFPNLQVLDLSASNITDVGMDALTRIPNLKHIDLRHSRVTPAGAKKLKDALPAATVLVRTAPTKAHRRALREFLRHGGLFVHRKHEPHRKNLMEFLEGDGLFRHDDQELDSDDLPLCFRQDRQWSDFDWNSLADIEGLKAVYLQATHASHFPIAALAQSGTIESLRISRTTLDQAAIDQIGSIGTLKKLAISGCKLDGIDFTRQSTSFQKLESLSLVGGEIHAQVFLALPKMPHLRQLSLTYCQLDNAALSKIPQLDRLEGVVLSATNLSDEGFQGIARCRNLERLNLMSTEITDASIDAILALPHVEWVGIPSELSDVGRKRIRHLLVQ